MKLQFSVLIAVLSLICGAAHAQTATANGSPTPQDTPAPAAAGNSDSAAEQPGEAVIVVTPNRHPQSLAESTSAVTVITRREIEEKKAFDLTDIIRLAPSVAIAQSGTRGKVASLFLRGANSNQTLVLIDGVRANSPADGRFDFGTIPIENVDHIEVLRGPQSTLYGSDAMGGVINIITRRGVGEFHTGGDIEFGSHTTDRQTLSARGSLGHDGLSLSATRLHSSGYFGNDDYRNLSASLRYDHALAGHRNLAFIGRIDNADEGTPGQEFLAFDPNARSRPHDLLGSLQYTNDAKRRHDRVVLGSFDRSLRFNDPINPSDPPAAQSFTNSLLKDRILSLDAQSSFDMGRHTLTGGAELRNEHASGSTFSTFGNTVFGQGTNTKALFAQDEFRTGRLALVPGLRLEDNSQFGRDLNGRVAASYDLAGHSKLKATIGTGFRAPAIDELYYPQSGDPTLKPEKSVGYEVGYERSLGHRGRMELTLFRNRYRNLIGTVLTPKSPTYPFGFKAGNAARATTQGLEIGYDQPFGDGFRAIINHAFINTSASGGPLLRRPRFTTSADLLYHRSKIGYDLGLVAQGRRYDNDFAAPPFGAGRGLGIYSGYSRVDLTLSYDLRPGLQVYTRAQNLLDRRYEEVAGFPAPGFNFVIGLQTRAF